MKTETVSISISADAVNDASDFAVVGGLVMLATHIQKQKEIVVTLNPNVTDYSTDEVEVTWSAKTGFKIFDIHERQTHTFTANNKNYEIEFMTWSRPRDGVVSFVFEVRYEE